MSGLVGFFRAFLPTTTTVDRATSKPAAERGTDGVGGISGERSPRRNDGDNAAADATAGEEEEGEDPFAMPPYRLSLSSFLDGDAPPSRANRDAGGVGRLDNADDEIEEVDDDNDGEAPETQEDGAPPPPPTPADGGPTVEGVDVNRGGGADGSTGEAVDDDRDAPRSTQRRRRRRRPSWRASPPPRAATEWRARRSRDLERFMTKRIGNPTDGGGVGDREEEGDEAKAERSNGDEGSIGSVSDVLSVSSSTTSCASFFSSSSSSVQSEEQNVDDDDVMDVEKEDEKGADEKGVCSSPTAPETQELLVQARRQNDTESIDDGYKGGREVESKGEEDRPDHNGDEKEDGGGDMEVEEEYEVPDNDSYVVPFLDTQDLIFDDDDDYDEPPVEEGEKKSEERETAAALNTQVEIDGSVEGVAGRDGEGSASLLPFLQTQEEFHTAPEDGGDSQPPHRPQEGTEAFSAATADGATEEQGGEERKEDDASSRRSRWRTERKASRRRRRPVVVVPHIPHIDKTTGRCSSVHELDLRSGSLHLSLCRVLKVWGIRRTKRMLWQDHTAKKANDGQDVDVDAVAEETAEAERDGPSPPDDDSPTGWVGPFKSWEDDGPLCTIYKQVLSLELLDLTGVEEGRDDDAGLDALSGQANGAIHEAASAAFPCGKERCDADAARRRRRRKRRIRVFFYNKFAVRMSQILSTLEGTGRKNGKKNVDEAPVLLSLRNVPAKCIIPFEAEGAREPLELLFGDETHGRLSRLSVCIGDKSKMSVNLPEPDHDGPEQSPEEQRSNVWFDSDGLEIRVVRARASINAIEDVHDVVLSSETVARKPGWNILREASELVRSYEKLTVRQQIDRSHVHDRAKDKNGTSRADHEPHFEAAAEKLNDKATGGDRNKENKPPAVLTVELPCGTESGRERPAGPVEDGGRRGKRQKLSPQYHRLGDLRSFLDEVTTTNQKMQDREIPLRKIDDTVNVYGAVLGFSQPSMTRRGEWMVSVTLVDETLPLTTAGNGGADSTCDAVLAGGLSTRNGGIPSNATGDVASSHVPCITLVVFSKDRTKLPKIKRAGDVLRCHRVAVQEWHSEIQLLGKRHSSFVVARPMVARSLDNMLHDSKDPETWCVIETAEKSFTWLEEDFDRSNSLWRWAQRRISSHPTVNQNQKFTVSLMGSQDETSAYRQDQLKTVNGDLTAIITAIIPVPEAQRGRSLPRGFLRVWDGSGPSYPDPLPIDSLQARESIWQGDPPTPVLCSIADIVGKISGSRTAYGPDKSETAGFVSATKNLLDAPKSLCGRVVNVAIWEESHWDLMRQTRESQSSGVQVGKFIRLRNIDDGKLPISGLRCLMVHPKSHLTPLPDEAYEVRILLQRHHERILRKERYNPQSGLLPLEVYTNTLGGNEAIVARDVAEQEEVTVLSVRPPLQNRHDFSPLAVCLDEAPPSSFVVRFGVKRTVPSFEDESLNALCVPGSQAGTYEFQFAFKIVDETADLDAIVSNEVAEKIFGVNATEVCACDGLHMQTAKHQNAVETLSRLLKPGRWWEGEIQSVSMDGSVYFILDSISAGSDRK